jgi:hypothetical protein
MTGSQPPGRQYTDKEVRAILQRTVALQATGDPANPAQSADGTTLDQLQQAAAELGLDPALVARAAAEVVADPDPGRGSWLLGGPWSVDSDYIVEGMVTEDDWPLLLEEMRAATGRVGHPKTVGKAFEWLSLQPDGLHVSLTPHGANTRVRVTARFGGWAVLFYVMPPPFFLALAVILCTALGKSDALSAAGMWALVIGLPLASLVGGRLGFGRLCARKRRQTRDLIARMERWIAGPRQGAVAPASTQTLPVRTTVEQPLATEQINRLT